MSLCVSKKRGSVSNSKQRRAVQSAASFAAAVERRAARSHIRQRGIVAGGYGLVARYNANGTVDTTFGVLPDNRVVIKTITPAA